MERTYRISDVVSDEFIRFPLTLLANPQYKEMSLEAKFIYSLLLNRLTLSQKNGWVNEDNEVYLIYTREDAAALLNISYKKAIAAFKELIGHGLLYEQRQGRGYPNLLFVLKAELNDTDAEEFSENYDKTPEETEPETPEKADGMQICQNGTSRPVKTAVQDLPKSHIKTCQNDSSRTADTAHQELPNRHPTKIDNINNQNSYMENSQSVRPAHVPDSDGPADESDMEALEEIYERCEMPIFKPNIQTMFQNAIERLYYSDTLKIGNARLPRAKVRSYLHLLDSEALITALDSMKQNEERIKNPTAYLMSVLFNAICEKESDLILSLPPEYLRGDDFYQPAQDYRKEVESDAPE